MFLLGKATGVLIVATVLLLSGETNAGQSSSSLRRLTELTVNSLGKDVQQKCATYEQALRRGYPADQQAALNRDKLFAKVLAESDSEQSPSADVKRVVADIKQCMAPSPTSTQATGPTTADSAETEDLRDRDMFLQEDISALSDVNFQANKKNKGTLERCKDFDKQLRRIYRRSRPELVSASPSEVLTAAIERLKKRRTPVIFPKIVLDALEICAATPLNFSFNDGNSRYTVIAGPQRGQPQRPKQPEPMKEAYSEFQEVKKRQKDFGQDIYYRPGPKSTATRTSSSEGSNKSSVSDTGDSVGSYSRNQRARPTSFASNNYQQAQQEVGQNQNEEEDFEEDENQRHEQEQKSPQRSQQQLEQQKRRAQGQNQYSGQDLDENEDLKQDQYHESSQQQQQRQQQQQQQRLQQQLRPQVRSQKPDQDPYQDDEQEEDLEEDEEAQPQQQQQQPRQQQLRQQQPQQQQSQQRQQQRYQAQPQPQNQNQEPEQYPDIDEDQEEDFEDDKDQNQEQGSPQQMQHQRAQNQNRQKDLHEDQEEGLEEYEDEDQDQGQELPQQWRQQQQQQQQQQQRPQQQRRPEVQVQSQKTDQDPYQDDEKEEDLEDEEPQPQQQQQQRKQQQQIPQSQQQPKQQQLRQQQPQQQPQQQQGQDSNIRSILAQMQQTQEQLMRQQSSDSEQLEKLESELAREKSLSSEKERTIVDLNRRLRKADLQSQGESQTLKKIQRDLEEQQRLASEKDRVIDELRQELHEAKRAYNELRDASPAANGQEVGPASASGKPDHGKSESSSNQDDSKGSSMVGVTGQALSKLMSDFENFNRDVIGLLSEVNSPLERARALKVNLIFRRLSDFQAALKTQLEKASENSFALEAKLDACLDNEPIVGNNAYVRAHRYRDDDDDNKVEYEDQVYNGDEDEVYDEVYNEDYTEEDTEDNNQDEYNSEDDSDYEEDHELSEKDKKKMAKKTAKKMEKEMEKEAKKAKKAVKDAAVVYNNLDEVVSELKRRLDKKGEPLAQRCQKYLKALNHPGRVTKLFIKNLVDETQPALANSDSGYYNNLRQYADRLKGSSYLHTMQAGKDLEACLQDENQQRAGHSVNNGEERQQRPLGPYEIPVTIIKGNRRPDVQPDSFNWHVPPMEPLPPLQPLPSYPSLPTRNFRARRPIPKINLGEFANNNPNSGPIQSSWNSHYETSTVNGQWI